MRFASFMVLNIFPSIRATSMIEPARAGLKTEPRDSHPSMYIGVEVPEILKPLYSSIAVCPFASKLVM